MRWFLGIFIFVVFKINRRCHEQDDSNEGEPNSNEPDPNPDPNPDTPPKPPIIEDNVTVDSGSDEMVTRPLYTYIPHIRSTKTVKKPSNCPYGYQWVDYKCTRDVYRPRQMRGRFNRFANLGRYTKTTPSKRTKRYTLRSTWPNYDYLGFGRGMKNRKLRPNIKGNDTNFGRWAVRDDSPPSPKYSNSKYIDPISGGPRRYKPSKSLYKSRKDRFQSNYNDDFMLD